MVKHTNTSIFYNMYIGFVLGAFCLSALITLMYLGFGGFTAELIQSGAFWISLFATILFGTLLFRLWNQLKSSLDFFRAIILLAFGFAFFWILLAFGKSLNF